jgi:NAD(P)H-dependent flavin oxidoreductase YrpB (nitropropane dioxygenase family)
MLTIRFTDLVGCAVPIRQAAMGAVLPPERAAAVSNAGGLDMVGTALVVAQGGGGHVRGTVGVLAPLGEALDAFDVPVLAAGGIGTGRALAAVPAAGTGGASLGGGGATPTARRPGTLGFATRSQRRRSAAAPRRRHRQAPRGGGSPRWLRDR